MLLLLPTMLMRLIKIFFSSIVLLDRVVMGMVVIVLVMVVNVKV